MKKSKKYFPVIVVFLLLIGIFSQNILAYADNQTFTFDTSVATFNLSSPTNTAATTWTEHGYTFDITATGPTGTILGNQGNNAFTPDLLEVVNVTSNAPITITISIQGGYIFDLKSLKLANVSGSHSYYDITAANGTPINNQSLASNPTLSTVNITDMNAISSFSIVYDIDNDTSEAALNLDDILLNNITSPTYSVTYNSNGSTGGAVPTDAASYNPTDTVTVLGNTGTLVKTGYTFAGWNTQADGAGTDYAPAATFAMGSSNVTLYAKWTAVDYTVTYDGNTNTGGDVPVDGNAYNITDTVTALGNTGTLVKTGYTFAGWNTLANGTGTDYAPAATFAMGSSNVTLYAKWTENLYTVTYNGNGSTGGAVPTDGASYHNTDSVTVLANTGSLVRTGYTFAGWNTLANGTGTGYAPAATFAIGLSNVTLYAQWTAVDYTVTYDGNTNTGGAVPVDGNAYNITDTVTALGNTGTLVKTGYTLAGWNTLANGTGTDYAPGATFAMGSSNVTLYAKWTENLYTVTYNGNGSTGGVVPTDGVSYHNTDSATVLGNTGTLVRAGYTFAGWNTLANGTGTGYAPAATFAIGLSNVTLYAQWTAVDYTVTYDGNTNTGGAVPVDGNAYNITDTVTALGNTGTLVKTGYTFAGWNTLANGTGTDYAPGATFAMGSSNVTLYAKWTENLYTVTYNGNGSTGGAVPTDGVSYHNTDSATVLGNTGTLVRTGYTFAGWNTLANGTGTGYAPAATFAIGLSNVTLYAQWTAVDYTVTYDGNTNTGGAVPVDGNAYNITDTVTALGNTGTLVKTGYTFAGWNTLANGTGTNYAPGATFAMGSSNVTLYAKWTEDVYTVTYNSNGSTGGAVPTDGVSYHTTDTVTALGNTGTLVKTGYIFAGWNTQANGTGTDYAPAATFAMGSSNVTLYAQWTAVDYTVTYNGNTNTGGAVPVDGSTYNITDIVTALGNTGTLVKTGYTFAGWNTLANGTGTNYAPAATFAMGAGNVTLYAKWTANATYTVTYNGNGSTGGSVPTDGTSYYTADTVTALGNTGTLVKTGYTFAGWNTLANGTGTDYAPAATFAMGSGNVTLYAKWTANATYTVTYNGNGSTGGTIPTDGTSYYTADTITTLGNTGTLVKMGYTFAGWNTLANGTGTDYAPAATFAMGSSNVILYAKWTVETTAPSLTAGVVTRTSDTVGTVKFTSNEAGSYYYAVVADGATAPVIDTTGAGVICTTAETMITNPTGLTAGAKDIYIKVKDGAGNVSTALKIDIAAYVASGGGSSGGSGGGSSSDNSNTPVPTTQPTPTPSSVVVVVNGKGQSAGNETTSTVSGKSTVTVKVENKVIDSKIDEAIKNNPAGVNNVIQVPVGDTKSEIAKVELTGDIIKKLEQNTFDVSIKRDNVEYVIGAEEFTISRVAQNLGVLENNLQDIKIEVQMTKLDQTVVAKYNEVAKANGAELVFPPMAFELVAKTTKTDGTTGTVEISKFSNYVERVMEIPAGADPKKLTTGIVFNADGTYSHVPTDIFQKDGKWYASLNSLTNSNYSVIWNPIVVKSVEKHWSKNAVNDMASRLVVFNAETFEPNKAITRADFAEYIVRALGLYREGSTHVNNFKDVSATGARTLAILIANEYGIVSGYADGTFRGDNLITREEAMAMYQRAMKIAKLTGTDKERYKAYADFTEVGGWAVNYVKDVLAAHVFNGTSPTTLSPKQNLTYGEAAQAIKNLLVESKLINK